MHVFVNVYMVLLCISISISISKSINYYSCTVLQQDHLGVFNGVTVLSQYIIPILQGTRFHLLQIVWCRGDIFLVNIYHSGHFFVLKDLGKSLSLLPSPAFLYGYATAHKPYEHQRRHTWYCTMMAMALVLKSINNVYYNTHDIVTTTCSCALIQYEPWKRGELSYCHFNQWFAICSVFLE